MEDTNFCKNNMTRIFYILIIFFVFCSINIAIADCIPTNVNIVKNKSNGKFGIVNNETGKLIMPYKYEKIERIGTDFVKRQSYKYGSWSVATNNNRELLQFCDGVYIQKIDKTKPQDLDNSIIFGYKKYYSESFQILVNDSVKQNLAGKIIHKNNNVFPIKFSNYPQSNFIVIRDNSKYGFISQTENIISIIPPQFDEIYSPDRDSAIYKFLGISFFDNKYVIAKKNNKWGLYKRNGEPVYKDIYFENIITFDSQLYENCDNDNNTITCTYQNINNTISDKYIIVDTRYNSAEIKNKNSVSLAKIPSKDLIPNTYKSVKDRIQENNEKSFIKFYNFPDTGIIVTNNCNGKKGLYLPNNKKIPEIYDDFYFADSNSLIYRLLGISYDSPDKIIAKKKNKWGIIDANNDIIVDFIYDSVFILPAKISASYKENIDEDSKIHYETRMKNNHIDITFNAITIPDKNIYVTKENQINIIDKNGKIIFSKMQENSVNTITDWQDFLNKTSKVEKRKSVLNDIALTAHDYAMIPAYIFSRIKIIFMMLFD